MPGRINVERANWIRNYRIANGYARTTYHQGRREWDRRNSDPPVLGPLRCFHTGEEIPVGELYVVYNLAHFISYNQNVPPQNIYSTNGFRMAGAEPSPRNPIRRVGLLAPEYDAFGMMILEDHRPAEILRHIAAPVVYDDTPDFDDSDDDMNYLEDNDDDPYEDSDSQYNEDVEIYSDDTPPRMAIPALDGRRSRMVSVEQEVIRGGRWISNALYNAGYAEDPGRHSYSASDTGNYLALVKADGSVDSEVVYSKMMLDHAETAEKFQAALEIVRNGIGEGNVRLSEACGLHIHVDIHGWTMTQISNMYHLWNYLEQPIFRIAAAHWKKGHRSLMGNTYSPQTEKGATEPRSIGQALQGVRGALNFQNFMSARRNCGCAAQTFGVWDSCTCGHDRLGKTTVEFRVFNTTANLRKMKAYTALALALVGYAENHECTHVDFPSFEWNRGRGDVNKIQSAEMFSDQMTERLKFMLTELPFTQDEREDIFYCIKNSSIPDKVTDWETLNPEREEVVV